jgi:hypothetical protein
MVTMAPLEPVDWLSANDPKRSQISVRSRTIQDDAPFGVLFDQVALARCE